MSYNRRSFSGASAVTTLNGDINATATSLIVADATGWPTGSTGPFYAVIAPEEAGEEKILVTSRSGTTLILADAVDRGVDGSTAQAHTAGDTIYHSFTAVDADEANYTAFNTVGKVTTKGDTLAATGPNAFGRVTAGSDSHFLLADSAATTGVRWGPLPDAVVDSTAKFAPGVVDTAALAANSVTTPKIANGAVTVDKVAVNAVTSAQLAADSVTAAKIAANSVGTSEIADSSVTTSKIVDANVTTTKIADANVTTAKLGDEAVTTAKIDDGAVTEAKLAAAAWTSWTPTWTNFVAGNSTVTARYKQFGKTVDFQLRIELGSTSSIANNPRFSLPVEAVTLANHQQTCTGAIDDGTGHYYSIMGIINSGDTGCGLHSTLGAADDHVITSTDPFNWNKDETIWISGTYEAA